MIGHRDVILEPAGADEDFDDANYTYESNGTLIEKPYIKLLEGLSDVTIDVDDVRVLRLRCKIIGTLPIEFDWLKNEAPVIKERGRITTKHRTYESILRIKRPGVLDSGYYTCKGTNDADKVVESSARVRINNPNVRRPKAPSLSPFDRSQESLSSNSGTAKCVEYTGSACKAHLPTGTFVYFNHSDDIWLEHREHMLKSALSVISNSSDVTAACKSYASRVSCHHVFPVCDVTNPEVPKPIRICKADCRKLEREICPTEYRIAKEQNLMQDPLNILPDCDALRDEDTCAPLEDSKWLPPVSTLPKPEHSRPRLDAKASWSPKASESPSDKIPNAQAEINPTHMCYHGSGKYFRGNQRKTISGQTCLHWSKQKAFQTDDYPELRGHNYCRNPGGSRRQPWCFIQSTASDPTDSPILTKEYCKLPTCPAGMFPEIKKLEYDDSPANPITRPVDYVQYLVIGGAVIGLLLLACFIAIFYYCLRKSRKAASESSKNVPYLNGHVSNIRKPSSLGDQQVELSALLPRSSAQPSPPYHSLPMEIPSANIRFLKELGEGQFGKVWQGELFGYSPVQTESLQVAIKMLKDDASQRQKIDFQQESELMNRFHHPNIVELIGVCLNPNCMVFEYMMHGDLHEFLLLRSPYRHLQGKDTDRILLDHSDFLRIATQVAAGMEYLSGHHYVHRDLATRNCLVTDHLTIKISDFGLSRDIYASDYYRCQSQTLLPVRWMSPDAIMYGRFSEQTDVWSFGVTLWEIYSYGTQPYAGYSNAEVIEMVRRYCILEMPEQCPPRVYSIMMECWQEIPNRRPHFSELHIRLMALSNLSGSPPNSAIVVPPPAQSLVSGHSSAFERATRSSSSSSHRSSLVPPPPIHNNNHCLPPPGRGGGVLYPPVNSRVPMMANGVLPASVPPSIAYHHQHHQLFTSSEAAFVTCPSMISNNNSFKCSNAAVGGVEFCSSPLPYNVPPSPCPPSGASPVLAKRPSTALRNTSGTQIHGGHGGSNNGLPQAHHGGVYQHSQQQQAPIMSSSTVNGVGHLSSGPNAASALSANGSLVESSS